MSTPRNGRTKRSVGEALAPPPPDLYLPNPVSSASASSPSRKTHLTPSPARKSKVAKTIASLQTTPFPAHAHPTPAACRMVHDLLSEVHGTPERPHVLVDSTNPEAGCGQVPSVLDALVSTMRSAATTSQNSTAAREAMDVRYGRANYRAVLAGTLRELQQTIHCGGLATIKGKNIYEVLLDLDGREGGLSIASLDYLHKLSDDEAMRDLLWFSGVGPKTASCVMLFCLGRSSFAVDTHCHRIATTLGWVPPGCHADLAFRHLNLLIPAELKYGLHSLFVKHGRGCKKCASDGVTSMNFVDRCPIEKLVRKELWKGGSAKGKGKARRKKNAKREEEEDESEDSEEQEAEAEAEVESPRPAKRAKKTFSIVIPVTSRLSSRTGLRSDVKLEVGGDGGEGSGLKAEGSGMHGMDV